MNKIIKKYGQFIFGSLFVLYFLYTFSNAIDINKEVMISTLVLPILYLQSVGEFLHFYKKNGKPRLQDWMRIMLFITLVINFMQLVNNANGLDRIFFSITTISLNDAPYTLITILFAFVFLDIPYLLINKKNIKYSKNIYQIKRKSLVFGILILSTFAQGYLLFSGFSGYGSSLEHTTGISSLVKVLAGILNTFALIISAYIIFIESSKNLKFKILFYISIFIQVFLGLLSGMKEAMLIPLLYIGIVFILSGRTVPKKLLYIMIFVVILLYPINNSYRNVINDPYVNTGSQSLNMLIAVKKLVDEPLSSILDTGAKSYGSRGAMYPYFQYSINIEPEWDYYKHMSRYFALPIVWLIPRTIWADKPRNNVGAIFFRTLTKRDSSNSVTPTNIGWAYLEGGLLFVSIIFLLLGLLFEFFDKSDIHKPIYLIFYIWLLHKALKPEWDPYFMFASFIQAFVMYWLLIKLIGLQKVVEKK